MVAVIVILLTEVGDGGGVVVGAISGVTAASGRASSIFPMVLSCVSSTPFVPSPPSPPLSLSAGPPPSLAAASSPSDTPPPPPSPGEERDNSDNRYSSQA